MGAGTPLPYLKAWRQKRGYSMPVLAQRAGITRYTILALEHGTQGAHGWTVQALARELEVTPAELTGVNPAHTARFGQRTNPPITRETVRFALEWYRRVS
jgi:DNA-binding XRE family transcriptional regulator